MLRNCLLGLPVSFPVAKKYRHASENLSSSVSVLTAMDIGGRAIASEPLHATSEKWQKTSPNHLLQVSMDDIPQSVVASGEAMLES